MLEYRKAGFTYWMRDKVIPMDGAMTVPSTEVVIEILEQLGDFKGKTRTKAEKYIDLELLNEHARGCRRKI